MDFYDTFECTFVVNQNTPFICGETAPAARSAKLFVAAAPCHVMAPSISQHLLLRPPQVAHLSVPPGLLLHPRRLRIPGGNWSLIFEFSCGKTMLYQDRLGQTSKIETDSHYSCPHQCPSSSTNVFENDGPLPLWIASRSGVCPQKLFSGRNQLS